MTAPKSRVQKKLCLNCNRWQPRSLFDRNQGVYCKFCIAAMTPAIEQQVEDRMGGILSNIVGVLESNQPITPQIAERLLEGYSVDALTTSIKIAIAQLEGRWFEAGIVSWEEAWKRGGGKIRNRQLLYRYHKLLIDFHAKLDEMRAAADPMDGISADQVVAQMVDLSYEQLQTNDAYFERVATLIKSDPELMAKFEAAPSVIQATAEEVVHAEADD